MTSEGLPCFIQLCLQSPTTMGSVIFYRYLCDLCDTDRSIDQVGESSNQTTNTLGLGSELSAGKQLSSNYEMHTQSTRFFNDKGHYDIDELNRLLRGDVIGRTIKVTDTVAEELFPDDTFGFPINMRFIRNFHGSFLNPSGFLDLANFSNDRSTSKFLNQMIATIANFLRSTEQHPVQNIQPLRYFASCHSKKPVVGTQIKWMPDIMLLRLIDECTRSGPMSWDKLQALVEHTTSPKPTIRTVESTIAKDYLSLCAQPERDFLINLLFTGEGFHVVIADCSSLLETDVTPFDQISSIVSLVRMVMGLTFLPDSFLGIDQSFICLFVCT